MSRSSNPDAVTAPPEPIDLPGLLPPAVTMCYHRGEHIFDRMNPSSDLYRVINGTVKVSFPAIDGASVLFDIRRPSDFFGESAFLGKPPVLQTAIAMDDVSTMKWDIAELERLMAERPRLAFALMRFLLRRSAELTRRIESFCNDSIPLRLARALLHLSDSSSRPHAEVELRNLPLTHGMLAQYVGTSREVVTLCMNRFRQDGLLQYSRASIVVDRDALVAWVTRDSGYPVEPAPRSLALVSGG